MYRPQRVSFQPPLPMSETVVGDPARTPLAGGGEKMQHQGLRHWESVSETVHVMERHLRSQELSPTRKIHPVIHQGKYGWSSHRGSSTYQHQPEMKSSEMSELKNKTILVNTLWTMAKEQPETALPGHTAVPTSASGFTPSCQTPDCDLLVGKSFTVVDGMDPRWIKKPQDIASIQFDAARQGVKLLGPEKLLKNIELILHYKPTSDPKHSVFLP
ncbi:uncharacterized protein LOC121135391 [Mesocricetus auratus]|uniref:Uncharacterized protein LOC121135391 n=1 Tax=Mesocricetus auratus TaxID=10036 RepID=A0ABM2WGX9_MESAU|nr:uncharacterized protein LOC121135391 [Mesocricetus auratus]